MNPERRNSEENEGGGEHDFEHLACEKLREIKCWDMDSLHKAMLE